MKTELLAWLINATLATSLACCTVAVLRKPLRRLVGAQIAYRLWIVVPLAAIAASFAWPQSTSRGVADASISAAPMPVLALVVQVSHALSRVAADRWLLASWMAGAVTMALVFAWQQHCYVRRLRLYPAIDGSWRSPVEGASPAVIGVLWQKLVLPDRFEAIYGDTERWLVIAHERMHQKRRDPWALALCALVRVVFWFNPIVHMAATLFRRDVELACDATVMRVHPGSRRRYAHALLAAELADGALPIGCRWHLTPPMKERIMLLKQTLPSHRTRWIGVGAIAITSGASACLAMGVHGIGLNAASALVVGATESAGYLVKLDMRVDGKPAAQPHVFVRLGDVAMVKVDTGGKTWGLRFHIEPETVSKSGGVQIAADVFTGDERHVIGHPQLGLLAGMPGLIELNDPQATTNQPIYRVAVTVTPATMPDRPAPPVPPAVPPPPGMAVLPPPPPPIPPDTRAPTPPLPSLSSNARAPMPPLPSLSSNARVPTPPPPPPIPPDTRAPTPPLPSLSSNARAPTPPPPPPPTPSDTRAPTPPPMRR